MAQLLFSTILMGAFITTAFSLDNGLARTPPMGWLTWERFRCNTDCTNDPLNCISEQLIITMADHLANDGYAALGYNIVAIDDCWLSSERDANGELQPDPVRFPSGIPALADYVHNQGLLFGIYEDVGNFTCAVYPGLLGNYETDANTFANWTVDYIKVDGCWFEPADMDAAYASFGFYLNQTGRPIIYSGEGPFYQYQEGLTSNFTVAAETCNLWRNFDDINDSWDSVLTIVDYWGANQDQFADAAGPGAWNDPDMLIIGNFGLSYEQSKAQMAIWSIWAAPLIMSNDLRSIAPEFRDILQNAAVIAVDQDPLGIQGRRVSQDNGLEYYTKPITPNNGNVYSYAVAFLNRRNDGAPSLVSLTFESIGLTEPTGYNVTDLFSNENYGIVLPTDTFSVSVNPTGVVLLRCNIL